MEARSCAGSHQSSPWTIKAEDRAPHILSQAIHDQSERKDSSLKWVQKYNPTPWEAHLLHCDNDRTLILSKEGLCLMTETMYVCYDMQPLSTRGRC